MVCMARFMVGRVIVKQVTEPLASGFRFHQYFIRSGIYVLLASNPGG